MQLAEPNTHKDNAITFQKNNSMEFFVESIILSAFNDLPWFFFFFPSRFQHTISNCVLRSKTTGVKLLKYMLFSSSV